MDELFSVFSDNEDEGEIIKVKADGDKNSSAGAKEIPNDLLTSIKGEKRELDDDDLTETKKAKLDSILDEIDPAEFDNRIKVYAIEEAGCMHHVAVPPDSPMPDIKLPNRDPAKEYKFELDPFQKQSILCIENEQSVLVSAHTSAGKTVVAEYAIASSLRDKKSVIYTTPIKALSNQKYREFSEEFQDVGLMTGDVTINPTASCLIMTTEILRSMLYRGSQIMREVGWVIFDEIHYMRDKERGYVWEETIILLPDNVHYVFLSATIPNARQFAEWICHLHKQPCHVVYTDYRPVPLQHYMFPAGSDGLHLVVDEAGKFREENFSMAMAALQNVTEGASKDKIGRKGGMVGSNCYKIVKMIMERNFAPVIVFSFSKRECEAYALQMAKLDFNKNEEKKLVDEVFHNAMDVLSEEDRKLPQVEAVLPLLRRGIGIHHGGLLPILKETIEILFSEGLIKALFATETFAMGLNMPARTVLFTGCRKFDGKDFRWVTSGEYIQMSGRAGRRGLDDKGIVIMMVDEKMSPSIGKNLVKGQPDQLNSAFHLTYNMVLNLLRVEEINPEYMLERSFFQFQNYASIPSLIQRVKKLNDEYDGIKIPKEKDVAAYYGIKEHLKTLAGQFHNFLTRPTYIIPFLQSGRLVKIKNNEDDFGWGVIVNFKKQEKKIAKDDISTGYDYIVDVLLHLASDCVDVNDTSQLRPWKGPDSGVMKVVPCLLPLVSQISSVRIFFPSNLKNADNRMGVLKSIQEVKKRFPGGIPLLDPVEDMKIKDKDFKDIITKIEAFETRMKTHPLYSHPNLSNHFDRYCEKLKVGNLLKDAKQDLRKAKSLLQMDELKCRKRVLRRLGYCTSDDVIEVKGRVACELSSADELLLTEMIFNGIFNDLTVPQCLGLLSCFVNDEKGSTQPKLTEELSGPLRQMQEMARRIAKVSEEAKLDIKEDLYVEQFKPFLMDVVHAWAKGSSFGDICKMTDIFEGSIIRCMRRLEELLRQLIQAAKAIGNSELENKFAEGVKTLKRDIVFAASLYL